jgi:UDP-N-acetyl-D-galactosamine dehydrogenase
MVDLSGQTIGVVGLGYVGLPLAAAFARRRRVVGFDLDEGRVAELRAGRDSTLEVPAEDLARAEWLEVTTDPAELRRCGVFIVTVPTPIDRAKRPDLRPLERASRTVGAALSRGAVVIYESTVYPGCTEEVCVPILERASGLRFNTDFFVGYSPERINPGDRARKLPDIVKVTSGSTPEIADAIDALYREVVPAGTHRASSIAVAEAAKVIENTQRDLNIALMNELAIIFEKLGIDTQEVLAAAGTKWNFLPFRPGLVGGHCIGVDPYYLTYRAEEVGYHPQVILAGRRINDGMGEHVANRVARLMMRAGVPVVGSRILVLGLAFKENCPDFRNTRVTDLIATLQDCRAEVEIWDPWVDAASARAELGLNVVADPPEAGGYDALVLAVGHRQFAAMGPARIRALGREGAVLFDVKGVFDKGASEGRL